MRWLRRLYVNIRATSVGDSRRIRHVAGVRWGLVAGVGGVFVLVAVILLLALTVLTPQRLIDPRGLSRTDWLTHVESLRTAILQALGGLALLGTVYFSARTFRLNRRGQVTERFTRAIEQLASEKLAVRLGGIYALEQIALDSRELHWPVMEVLTAFLRENSGTPATRSVIDALEAFWYGQQHPGWDPDSARQRQPKLAADLQAIATVLGRRPEHRRRHEKASDRHLDLSGVWLPKVHLAGGHLEEANLSDAHLEWANLAGAHLRGANLESAHLYESNLKDAHLEGANFMAANLVRAEFGRRFPLVPDRDALGAHLAGAFFMGADMVGASLRGTDATDDQIGQGHLDETTLLPSTMNLDELLKDQRALTE